MTNSFDHEAFKALDGIARKIESDIFYGPAVPVEPYVPPPPVVTCCEEGREQIQQFRDKFYLEVGDCIQIDIKFCPWCGTKIP